MLAVGDGCVDIVMNVPHVPGRDQKVLGEFVGYYPGGTVANFACAASRLGLRVASLSEVGDDGYGGRILADFAAFGVDTSLVQIRQGRASPFAVVMLDRSGEKSLVYVPASGGGYDLEQAAKVLPRTRVLYTMPQPDERFYALADLAHRHGTKVMVDIEATVCQDRALLERILGHTDIACFNEEGFRRATEKPLSPRSVQELLAPDPGARGPEAVVVTRGGLGSVAASRGEWVESPAFRVPVADTTGAGDTFNAAFLAARLQPQPLPGCLAFASAAAAISVSALGARGHLPSAAEVEQFLQTHADAP